MKRIFAIVVAVVSLSGCATTFHGSPKIANGPAGCQQQCDAWAMDLVGMVAMGEYSDGCICQVRGQSSKTAAAVSGTGAAVAGVWNQMQEEERAATSPPPSHR